MCTESKRDKKEIKKKRHNKAKQIMKDIAWSLLFNFVAIIRLFVDKLLEICLEWYWGNDRRVCPPLAKGKEFLTKSAEELARMIRSKEITAYTVVSAYIERINQVNPVINAVIHGPFNEALDNAKEIDDRISRGLISEDEFSEKPFLGVPFSTKDSNAVKDKLHTLGILSRRHMKAKEDSEIVKLMKDAGAIVIATTSIPEINRWQETRNNLIGQTNNPYDNRRTVGGSSGGEAALIAACGTGFGLGSDIGGSIRMPAFYCGVYGHKPTSGIISTKGCTLRTGRETNTMVVAGPMTRHAADLRPITKILAGPKNVISLKLDEKTDLKKLRYFYIKSNGDIKCSAVCGELQNTMEKVVAHFQNIGNEGVKQVRLTGTDSTCRMWRYWMTQEPASFQNLLGNGKSINPFVELGKKILGTCEFTMASIYSLIDGLLPPENADKIREITRKCDEELTELLGDDGVLFYHSTTQPAPFHYSAFIQVYNFAYWSLFNVLHVPVTQVPLGLNAKGLPLGLQIVATRNRDRHCLAVAEEIEKSLGGFVNPFVIQ